MRLFFTKKNPPSSLKMGSADITGASEEAASDSDWSKNRGGHTGSYFFDLD